MTTFPTESSDPPRSTYTSESPWPGPDGVQWFFDPTDVSWTPLPATGGGTTLTSYENQIESLADYPETFPPTTHTHPSADLTDATPFWSKDKTAKHATKITVADGLTDSGDSPIGELVFTPTAITNGRPDYAGTANSQLNWDGTKHVLTYFANLGQWESADNPQPYNPADVMTWTEVIGGGAPTLTATQYTAIGGTLTCGVLTTDATTKTNLRNAAGLGTMATQAASAVAITGGAIDGTPIGATTASTIRGTTLTVTSNTASTSTITGCAVFAGGVGMNGFYSGSRGAIRGSWDGGTGLIIASESDARDDTNLLGCYYNGTSNAAFRVRQNGDCLVGKDLTATGTINGTEQASAPSAPSTNGYTLYAEDNGSGKTRLMVKFATGAAQQIAIEP